jgi:hypothetical protein
MIFKEIFIHYQILYSDVKHQVTQQDHLADINYSIQHFKKHHVLYDNASIAEKIKQYINENK